MASDTLSPAPDSAPPTPETPEEVQRRAAQQAKLVSEVRQHYQEAHAERKKHEERWFISGAFLRGQQHVEYNADLTRLVSPIGPSYKVKLDLNRIRPKWRARMAKFFKNRPKPLVAPASTDFKDILNARGTEKLLTYQWDRLHLEEARKDARYWASICGHGYWWFSIDPTASGRVRVNGQPETAPLGDVLIEVSSPFEVLVADPAISRIGDQPWIQRIRMLTKEDVAQRYPNLDPDLVSTSAKDGEGASPAADRMASLRAGGSGTSPSTRDTKVMVIEEFTAPNAKYAEGRYVVVVGHAVAREEPALPYKMFDHKKNPFPVVDFVDTLSPGQYWTTTFIEQLIDLQRQYNYLFELMTENIRAVSRPKLVIYRQHQLKDGAYTTASGEILSLTHIPGLPAPFLLQPANVSGDVVTLLQFYDRLFDEISQIYPASEGAVAKATSGFQTNLLQEATDTVHAPDVREDELSLQEAAWKIRRLCKLYYDVPRLFTIAGENSLPEVLEFSRDQIDEYAEVRIQAGSMLPDLKAAKAQSALELFDRGLFGDPQDPLVRKRVMSSLDLGGMEVIRDAERADADEAELEIQRLMTGEQVPAATFVQDHAIHLERKGTYMKSSGFRSLTPEIQQALVANMLGHLDWVNAPLAQGLRLQYGLQDLPLATPPPPQLPAPAGAGQATQASEPQAPPPPVPPAEPL